MAQCIDTIGTSSYLGPAERLGSWLGRTLDKALATLAQGAAGGILMLLAWQRRAAQRVHLATLPDHILKDVGLTRADIHAETRKAVWTA